MFRLFLFTLLFVLYGQAVKASAVYQGPVGGLSPTENQKLYNEYCLGNADDVNVPEVNYSSPEVIDAVAQMAKVDPLSYYFYGPVLRAYGLAKSVTLNPTTGLKDFVYVDAPNTAPKSVNPATNAFLVQLCGEFRDRATMIREKVRWLKNLFRVPVEVQKQIDPAQNIWSQLVADSYTYFLNFSSTLWMAKQSQLQSKKALLIANGTYQVDAPVDPQSVCETKYIFVKYLSNPIYVGTEGRQKLSQFISGLVGNYSEYKKGLEKFEASVCTEDDKTHFYDYRGDKNFKHNSPEANGMIWTASSIAAHCQSPSKARENDAYLKDADCQEYFRKPFLSRWASARAGLATWVFRDKSYDSQFQNPQVKVCIYQNKTYLTTPMAFSLDGTTVLNQFLPDWSKVQSTVWSQPDMGFNELVGLEGSKPYDINLAYERLRDAVNRHTNWYASAYDDQMGYKMDQVYSPYVASSHVISASDGFAHGMNGTREWMFIFKVKISNIRNTQTVANKIPVNFDTNWFDETSLGTEAGVYAKSERAMDRLGTAIEGEFDSILYLKDVQ